MTPDPWEAIRGPHHTYDPALRKTIVHVLMFCDLCGWPQLLDRAKAGRRCHMMPGCRGHAWPEVVEDDPCDLDPRAVATLARYEPTERTADE